MKERAKAWLDSDIRTDIGKIAGWLKRRKFEILITFGWSIAIALVVTVSYWLVYLEHPELTEHGTVVFTSVPQWTPRIAPLGYAIIILISLIAGALIVDLGKILFTWIATFFSSFFVAVFWAFLFVWLVLGVGQNEVLLSGLGSFAWEYVLERVLLNVFRMIFPLVPIACLLLSLVGAIIRAQIQPSAGTE